MSQPDGRGRHRGPLRRDRGDAPAAQFAAEDIAGRQGLASSATASSATRTRSTPPRSRSLEGPVTDGQSRHHRRPISHVGLREGIHLPPVRPGRDGRPPRRRLRPRSASSRRRPRPLTAAPGLRPRRRAGGTVDYALAGTHAADIYDGDQRCCPAWPSTAPPSSRTPAPPSSSTPATASSWTPTATFVITLRHAGRSGMSHDPVHLPRSSRTRCRRRPTRCSSPFKKTAMSVDHLRGARHGHRDHRRRPARSPRPAPAFPAFVGVLDKAVKAILARQFAARRCRPGDVFATNDPYYGGVTHLNDIIVAMPVFADGRIVAWTANIAHNSDVGGNGAGVPDRGRARDLSRGAAPARDPRHRCGAGWKRR